MLQNKFSRKNLHISWEYRIFAEKSKVMRAVIQRVTHASVTIEGQKKAEIEQGYLILLGICDEDSMEDVEWLVKKIANLRVFGDENDVMNRSILDVDGNCLVVSQLQEG